MTNAAPGWYPHAGQPGLELYWDGERWADQRKVPPPVRPAGPAPVVANIAGVPITRRDEQSKDLVNAGYACAILFPIAGVVIGIMLLAKEQVGSALAIIALSILTTVVLYQLLLAAA